MFDQTVIYLKKLIQAQYPTSKMCMLRFQNALKTVHHGPFVDAPLYDATAGSADGAVSGGMVSWGMGAGSGIGIGGIDGATPSPPSCFSVLTSRAV